MARGLYVIKLFFIHVKFFRDSLIFALVLTLARLANIRLALKNFAVSNTLAYSNLIMSDKEKGFITITTAGLGASGAIVIKLFTAVSYNFS